MAAMMILMIILSGKYIASMTAVLIKNAVLPSADFFRNLCFPKGIPINAASVSDIERINKAGTAISLGKRKIATTEPVKT